MRRVARSAALGAALTLAVAAPAAGNDFCATFGSNPLHAECDPGVDTFATGFKDAVNQANANPGPDRVLVGPGTYPYGGSPAIGAAGQGLIVDGSGRDATFMGVDESHETLFVADDPDTVVSDLEVQLGSTDSPSGLVMIAGAVERVDVTGSPIGLSHGLELADGAEADDIVIALRPATPSATAFGITTFDSGTGTVNMKDVVARATIALFAASGSAPRVQRGRYTGEGYGIYVEGVGDFVGDSFVARAAHAEFFAFVISQNDGSSGTTVVLRHATIWAPARGYGLFAGQSAGHQTHVDVANTVIDGPGIVDVYGSVSSDTSEVTIDLSHSSWRPEAQQVNEGGGGTVTITSGPGNLPGPDPRFVNGGGGDFRLLADSPLIDVGDPAPLALDESPFDYLGGDRLLDGDGDAVDRRDIGAEEFDPADPPPEPGDGDRGAGGGGDDGGDAPPPPVQPPVGPPGDPPVLVPPSPVFAPLSVRGGNRRVDRRGRVTFVIGCPAVAPVPCAGSVLLRTARRRALTLGRKAFTIAPGRTARVRVKVGRRGRRALRRARRLRVRAIVTAANASPVWRTFTLRPPRR
jgi:hypothetical protein